MVILVDQQSQELDHGRKTRLDKSKRADDGVEESVDSSEPMPILALRTDLEQGLNARKGQRFSPQP